MFEKLGHFVVRRRKSVLALFIVVLIAFGAMAGLAIPRLSGGGYSNPGSDAAKASTYLTDTFHVKDPAVVIEVKSTSTVQDPTVVASASALEKEIGAEKGVLKTVSYWSAGGAPTLVSKDGKAAYLFVYSTEKDPLNAKSLGKLLEKKYAGDYKNLKVYVGGLATFNS